MPSKFDKENAKRTDKIRDLAVYSEMRRILQRVSEEKYRANAIDTYKQIAEQVKLLTATNRKLWEREKDIEWLDYLADELMEHMKTIPEDLQGWAFDIYSKILLIKKYEEENGYNEYNRYAILQGIDWIVNKARSVKSY